jgi:opacity protein-like surface antigen
MIRKRFKFVIILLYTFSFTCSAQEPTAQGEHYVGLYGGFNYSMLTNPLYYFGEIDFTDGLKLGVTYEYLWKDRFSVGADLVYNQQGLVEKEMFSSELTIPVTNRFDYFSLPIKFGYAFGDRLRITPKLGFRTSIFSQAKVRVRRGEYKDAFEDDRFEDNENLVEEYAIPAVYGGLIELNFDYNLTSMFTIHAFIQASKDFTMTYDYGEPGIDGPYHYGFSAALGLKYRIQ